MHEIKLNPIVFENSRVRVSWTVEPATTLYTQNHFTLDCGAAFDPRVLPLKLWWTFALLCLHAHWNLLRPCRIILPIQLSDAEIEFWQRHLDLQRASWELFRKRDDFARTIEIVCEGERLDAGALPRANERYATAFSGGKESLLQASLLNEFTTRPLLVNAQSEMPPLLDHSTTRRAYVLDEIARRSDCQVIEIKSDFRSTWDNLFGIKQGYRQTLNEFCDEPFYLACLLVTAASQGIRHLCLGSEFEAHQGSVAHDGRLVNYYQTLSPASIRALDVYFKPWGISFGSLLTPLSHVLIEKILWRRYPHLADLQNSCFAMNNVNEGYCSRCRKCLRIATILLLLDVDPARLGIDVNQLYPLHSEWNPNWPPIGGAIAYAAQHIELARARKYFRAENLFQQWHWQMPPAYRALTKLVAHFENAHEDWVGFYQAPFAKYIPESLRARLDAMYRDYAPGDPNTRADEIAGVDATIQWLTEPLRETT